MADDNSDRNLKGRLNALRRELTELKNDLATLESAKKQSTYWKMLVLLLALVEVVRGTEAAVRYFSSAG